MEIRDNGRTNPLIVVSADEVAAWLRSKCDEAGYGDRQLCAIQISVEDPFGADLKYHHETPSLVCMVSNVKDSRPRD